MTLLSDLEQQTPHRQRGHHLSLPSPPPLEVNGSSHQKDSQSDKSSEESAEDLRVCCNSRMEEVQRSPIKTAFKRSLSTEDNNGNISEEGAEKKRRIENIVTNICQPRSPKPQDINMNNELQKNKRKQFTPQQHGNNTVNGDIDVVTAEDQPVKPAVSPSCFTEDKERNVNQNLDERKTEKENALLKSQIKIMSEQLQKNQQMTHELTEKIKMERYELMSARLALHQPQIEIEACIRAIRADINQAVKTAVKEAMEKHSFNNPPAINKDKATSTIRESAQRETTPAHSNINNSNSLHIPELNKRSNPLIPPAVPSSPHITAPPAHHSLPNPLLPLPLYYPGSGLTNPSHFSQPNSLASHLNNNMMSAQLFHAAMENELIESQLYHRDRENPLKKPKRTKVTDTRLSPRTSKPNEQNTSPTTKQEMIDPAKIFDTYGPGSALLSAMNPNSMAAMQNALLSGFCAQQQSEAFKNISGGVKSPANMSDNSDQAPSSPEMVLPAIPGQNVTLTPLHLRKAKLMFFYVRYPSSVLLKNFFCDVHFNKNNTAQLVKWFSNFREFYYIQMEKYARQSLAEGLTAEQVEVTTESELYKILNLHYNRNNQIEVPRSFLDTIQTTLREFVKAIAVGKDREQSWKKPIYKVIARLDDVVPEYFKSQDWMEQLSD